MRRLGMLCLLVLASTLVACAPPREANLARVRAVASPLAHGSAQICVMRPETLARDVSMEVRDNGRLVGATRGGTYVCWLAATGEHQLTSIDDDTGPTWLEARANARYWLHQEVSELGGRLHAHLDWVDEPTAAELIDACDERVRVAVPGHDDEPDALTIAPAKARR
jgi:hypothetical protein